MNINEINKELQRKYITTKQAAEILKMTRRNIIGLCVKGDFEGAGQIDDIWFIPRKSVENYTRKKRGAKSKAEIQALINEAVANALKAKEQEAKQTVKNPEQSQQLELF